MKKIIASFLLAFGLLCGSVEAKIRVLTIGDSTMADYDEMKNSGENEMRGWAQMLPLFFNQEVAVENAAKNGRSSKSFYYEFWEKLRETLKPGDYVVIQFGHNDEKNNGQDSDPTDHTGRGTAPWGQFQDYLTRYVKESRQKGAIPVLATPIVRRMFDAQNIELSLQAKHNLKDAVKSPNDTLLDYVLAMKDVAKKLNVPLVDMTALTEATVKGLGADKSKEIIYCTKDNTHLKALGALMYANLFADDIRRQGILAPYLSYPQDLLVSPQNIDFGSQFVGEASVKALSLIGVGLKSDRQISLSVAAPFSVSLSPNKDFSDKVELQAHAGDFYRAVYVRFVPSNGNSVNKPFPLLVDGKKQDVAFAGQGIAADRNATVVLEYSSKNGLISRPQAQIDSHIEGLKYLVDKNETILTTLNGQWPSDEIDMNASRYVELTVKAKKNMYLSEISYRLSGLSSDIMQFTALGSSDPSFARTDTYSLMETMSEKPKQYNQRPMLKLTKGKTYYFRIYPWRKKGGDESFFKVDNVIFIGYEAK